MVSEFGSKILFKGSKILKKNYSLNIWTSSTNKKSYRKMKYNEVIGTLNSTTSHFLKNNERKLLVE